VFLRESLNEVTISTGQGGEPNAVALQRNPAQLTLRPRSRRRLVAVSAMARKASERSGAGRPLSPGGPDRPAHLSIQIPVSNRSFVEHAARGE
jgi:hypothetical protein